MKKRKQRKDIAKSGKQWFTEGWGIPARIIGRGFHQLSPTSQILPRENNLGITGLVEFSQVGDSSVWGLNMKVYGMSQWSQGTMRSNAISEIRFNLEGPRFRILCYSDLRYR